MKKLILAMVFVFATETMMNATSINKEIREYESTNLNSIALPSCLIDAYNATNKLESESSTGAYSWRIELWAYAFETIFEDCQNGGEMIDRINM